MTASTCEWIELDEAVERLGRGYSKSNIRRKIKAGELMEGVHFCRPSPRTLRINVNQIIEEWSAA